MSACSPDSVFLLACAPATSMPLNGSGTIFSAPMVGGAAAIAKGCFPGLDGNQLKAHLKNTGDDVGATGAARRRPRRQDRPSD